MEAVLSFTRCCRSLANGSTPRQANGASKKRPPRSFFRVSQGLGWLVGLGWVGLVRLSKCC